MYIFSVDVYCRVGLLSACAYNFRRKLLVKIVISVRSIRLINNYGVLTRNHYDVIE